MPIANFKAKHVRDAAKFWDRNPGVRGFRNGTQLEVLIGGKCYPPKAIISIAHQLAGNKPLLYPKDFQGGQGGKWHRLLNAAGFQARPKTSHHVSSKKSKRPPLAKTPAGAPIPRKSISKFYARLGLPLHNVRWSWGARAEHGVLLTTWTDHLDKSGRFVRVGRRKQDRSLDGWNERMDHLRTLWSGGIAGYAVLATADNTENKTRVIKSYDGDNVREIITLTVFPDNSDSIWAELGENVSVKRLKKHAASHRLLPGKTAFPFDREPSKIFRESSASYIAKLPRFRKWLIEVARRRETVSYEEARKPFEFRTLEHRHAMDRIGHMCLDAGEPILTSLIVDSSTGRCSGGFDKEFRCDDAEMRQDCYAFWSPLGGEIAKSASGAVSDSGSQLRERAARFSKVATRPEQAAFRRRVFLACKGACVVTGCMIPEALDAAHRAGRDWRLGHNNEADGLLIRKDIHALYDAQLVSIAEDCSVTFARDVEPFYLDYLRKS